MNEIIKFFQDAILAEDMKIIVPIIAVIVTLIFNIKASRDNTTSRYASFMNQIVKENYTLISKEPGLKSDEELLVHAQMYLDFMNSVAYLSLKKKIPREIGKYMRGYFIHSQLWIKWYNAEISQKKGFRPVEKDWPHIKQWCEKINVWEYHGSIRCAVANAKIEKWEEEFDRENHKIKKPSFNNNDNESS
jgi:hypothetical protein